MVESRPLSEEEARLVEGLKAGMRPAGAITEGQNSAPPVLPESGFDRRDLLTLPYEPQRHVMANGKAVWVHAISLEDEDWLAAHAIDAVKPANIPENASVQSQMKAQLKARRSGELWGHVYQVIACCRQGPEVNSPPVFQPTDAHTLFRNPGWRRDVAAIVTICDRLTEGQPQQEAQAVTDFFGAIQSWGETLCSKLSAGTEEASAISRFVACVGSMRERGQWSAAEIEVLTAELMG